MVIAARRAYSDAVRWVRSDRPRSVRAGAFGGRAFTSSFVVAVVVLGIIGLISPARFGTEGSVAFRSGWPAWLLVGLVAICGIGLFARRRALVRFAVWASDPWRRPLVEHPAYRGLAGALHSCPAPFRARFALGWVWGPVAFAAAGAFFAFSAAYFVVDAVLARFSIGWQQAALLGANALLSWLFFALGARRLATWPLAASAYLASA